MPAQCVLALNLDPTQWLLPHQGYEYYQVYMASPNFQSPSFKSYAFLARHGSLLITHYCQITPRNATQISKTNPSFHGSRRQCSLCISFLETTGHQCLRRDPSLEVGIRCRFTIWHFFQVSIYTNPQPRGAAAHPTCRSKLFGNERFKPRHGEYFPTPSTRKSSGVLIRKQSLGLPRMLLAANRLSTTFSFASKLCLMYMIWLPSSNLSLPHNTRASW